MQLNKRLIFKLTLIASALLRWTAQADQVVISEIMYHPRGEQPEFVELTNITATPLDIIRWRFTNGVNFDFPDFDAADPQASFLQAYQRLVIASVDPETFREAYQLPASVRVIGPWDGQLSDSGEQITLKDKNGTVVSQVTYRDRGRWHPGADGTGHTLSLIDPEAGADNWRNWQLSSKASGSPGTPEVTRPEEPVRNPEVNLAVGLPVIEFGDEWKFQDRNQNLGTAWQDPDFDDSAWMSGPGLLGFENSALPAPGIQTGLLDSNNGANHITYYFRKEFTFEGDPTGASFSIDQIVDDGAFYYLNGQPVGGAGVNANADWKETASRNVGNADVELAVASGGSEALRQGRNVLAAEAHQVNANSSDMVFGAQLNIAAPTTPSVIINEILATSGDDSYIEFYNPTGSAFDLNGFSLSDNRTALTKFPITTSVIVPANGLNSVPFASTGFTLSDPLVVFLSNPDGDIVSAIDTSIPLDGRSLGRKPSGGSEWFLFTQPTPDEPNGSSGTDSLSLRLNEVHLGVDGIDWIEFVNQSLDASATLDGLAIASLADLSDKVALIGEITAGAMLTVDLELPADGNVTLFLVNADNKLLQAVRLDRKVDFESIQAFPDGGDEWYRSTTATPNEPNAPSINRAIVINEIMVDPPSNSRNGEFVELYNRGNEAVDLTDWDFSYGINFSFPSATLAPGEYIVIAADASRYENAQALGNFGGTLSNRGELLRLEDAAGNLVDQVDYRLGGDWPRLVNGDGSSLELIHPDMDNDFATAWKDSDESTKGEFTDFVIDQTYKQLRTGGSPSDFEEMHIHLVGDAHIIIKDLKFQFQGAGNNLFLNSDKISPNGSGATGWLCQGTHWASFYDGTEFHLISDGHGDNRPNRAELDVPVLGLNNDYTMSFKARWVSGNPRFIVQTWEHSFGGTFLVPLPDQLGTPGTANSQLSSAPAPQVASVRHSPAVPTTTSPVRILAEVAPSSQLDKVEAVHRRDTSSGDGDWNRSTMNDAGIDGDEFAGDGIYTATITDYQTNGQVVEFFVQALGSNGKSTQLPIKGEAHPGMWVVDNNALGGDLRNLRFVVSEHDLRAMNTNNGESSEYDFNFPRLSNHYFNMTFISNEEKIIYACEIRKSGSAFLRSNNSDLSKAKWKIPTDHYYRGRSKLALDNDAASNNNRHHNRLTRYWLYLLGSPVFEGEYVQATVNNDAPGLREEIEPPGNDYFDRVYENGSNGELYRADDEWWFTDSWNRDGRDADWSYKNTDEPIRYHTEWIKRSKETEYDYSSLISMFKTVSGNKFSEEGIDRIMDADQLAIYAAVRGYTDDWDSITLRRGKNCFLYRKPTDGRFILVQWDSDLAFSNPNAELLGNLPGIRNYFTKPYVERRFNHYLTRMLDDYTIGSPRLSAWFDAEEASSALYTMNRGTYEEWNNNRANRASNQVGNSRNEDFAVTTGNGESTSTADDIYSISGTSPSSVYAIKVADHPEASLAWSGTDNWAVSGLVLSEGENYLIIQGVNADGDVITSQPFLVTKTTNGPPSLDLEVDPASLNVSLAQTLDLDAKNSSDPEDSALTFVWQVTPEGDATLVNGDATQATVAFNRPGLYTINLTASDAAEAISQLTREAAVFAEGDFMSFNSGSSLPTELEPLRATPPQAGPYEPSYSVETRTGQLTLSLPGIRSYPITGLNPLYPLMQRLLPSTGDFVLQTELRLDGVQLGDFYAGLTLEATQEGRSFRFAFGMENGTSLTVKRGTTSLAVLKTTPFADGKATIRIRKTEMAFYFEVRSDTDMSWTEIASAAGIGEVFPGGLFASTDVAQPQTVSYDYLMLVDPSNVSDVQRFLRVSEIMYHPRQGDAYEFIELQNTGETPLALNGVTLTAGRPVNAFTFGDITLEPSAYTILAASAETLRQAYDASMPIAGEWAGGKLSNDGERIEITDQNGKTVLDFSYNDSTIWPGEADGGGKSLEVIDTQQSFDNATNWSASTAIGGTPAGFTLKDGGQGGGDTDGDGLSDEEEVALGTNPAIADTDGDGISDGLEVILGIRPTDGSSNFRVLATVIDDGSVTFTWPSASGNSYTVESSADLITENWKTVTTVEAVADTDQTSLSLLIEGSDAQYFRIRFGP